jgi:GR25 family glycosyltransferase involved in LPS biosynthesis
MKYNFYILSLLESEERRENVTILVNKLKENGHHIDNIHIIKSYYYKSCNLYDKIANERLSIAYNTGLSLTQLGCFLSHREAWKKIATSESNEVHIILEDDMNIDNNISLNDFTTFPDYEAIILWRHPEQKNKSVTYYQPGLLEFYFQWGLCAYAITPKFANNLIEHIKHIDEPADIMLYSKYFFKDKVFITENSPFINLGFLGGYNLYDYKYKSWIFG